jgi:hypothetical protein
MIGNSSFANMATLARHLTIAGRTLAGAVQRSSLVVALKGVCNRLVHHAARRDSPDPVDPIDPESGAKALSVVIRHLVLDQSVRTQGFSVDQKKTLAEVNKASCGQLASSLKSEKLVASAERIGGNSGGLEEFKLQLEAIGSLGSKWQNKPLYALGRELVCMLDADLVHGGWRREAQLSAIKLFFEAVDKLPESDRHGLWGMYEAAKPNAKENDAMTFHRWEHVAHMRAMSEILASDAKYSQSSRQAIAAKYGLKSDNSLRSLERGVMGGPATDLLRSGSSVSEALKTHDLRFTRVWGDWWGHARQGFDKKAAAYGADDHEVSHRLQYYFDGN